MIKFEPTPKQHETWLLLEDHITQNILFGGGNGGGKSYLIAAWLIINSIRYRESRWVLGRSRLTTLKKTTLNTIRDLIKKWDLSDKIRINLNENSIKFWNGSEILLFNLYPDPSDPDFDSLGSLEISGVAIDELSEISFKAFQVLSSRIRYKLDEFNIVPKILCCSNPTRSWVYNFFVKNPDSDTKFVQCLVGDNKHISMSYIKTLNKLDFRLKQRLLYGNWEFLDSDDELIEYEQLLQSFYNEIEIESGSTMYMTVDVGDLGSDSTFITIWKGWKAIEKYILKKTETTGVVEEIKRLMNLYKILIKNIIIDSVGVGAGVASYMKGCVRYVGNSSSLNNEKFQNIKAQLMYKYAEMINEGRVQICWPMDDKFIEDHLAYKKVIKNESHGITSKDEIKRKLGRSPDTIDSMYLRSYWEFTRKIPSKIRILNF